MEGRRRAHAVALCLLWLWAGGLCQENAASVYIVTLKQAPTAHYYDLLRSSKSITGGGESGPMNTLNKPRNASRPDGSYGKNLIRLHDSLLRRVLKGQNYLKLYSYRYILNGFAVLVTAQQARGGECGGGFLCAHRHDPHSGVLGLAQGGMGQGRWSRCCREGVVIGFIDTGIDPTHPSFSDEAPLNVFPVPLHFSGVCEVTRDFPSGSCNRKLIGARHFAASAITRGIFNATKDYASPFDGDGHGTHTASIAAGNHGVPVIVAGITLGTQAAWLLVRSNYIAVYKALYKSFGGFAADVVAAIDQAAQDGVDIISLSITPNRRPPGIATFFNPIDMALLSAVKTGIFVVQAAGNTGPSPRSMSSFSPWIFTVGAAAHDRVYSNCVVLGNNHTISGLGLARNGNRWGFDVPIGFPIHALRDDASVDTTSSMYVGECQDPSPLDKDSISGNILICSYSVRFVLGLSTIRRALETAKNLSARGIIFYMDPFVMGFQLNPTPMKIPGLMIPSPEDSKIFLQYYNSSIVRDEASRSVVKLGGVARIFGGLRANYSNLAPKVLYYSARGPDPEDNSFHDSDIMKPNLIAPATSYGGLGALWALTPWNSKVTKAQPIPSWESFALISGTSMAAPHVAGLAALIKQKFPGFSPSAVASALSTTASVYDKQGGPIMAQRAYTNPDASQSPATPFDMGSGFVNATAALDPGLIFDSSFDDYLSFLCAINGSGPVVLNYTGRGCGGATVDAGDLNLPSITVSLLNQSRTVSRRVTNVAGDETYAVTWSSPFGVSVSVSPSRFFISAGRSRVLTFVLNATMNSSSASFGRIGLYGTGGHVASIPLSVISKVNFDKEVK
ncbi:unnamed protein product [Spirodela intermedia]|uniref:Uncharacterized protein n=1 Tax=Spirodela intermedia TaxID=51605 RepID=A0A7I8IJL8_SPIIN|nr:unnamed protein product [Spirodela intermedia]CAA6657950.1 unnamed protein product [Spirodela intermedia]